MQQLTETQKAYLAGIIDGEGCITIGCNQGRYYFLMVVTNGTIEHHIRACAEMARLGHVSYNAKTGNSADQWRWQATGSDAATLLRTILPYLILKADQARLGLRFYDHMQNSPAYNGQTGSIPPAVLDYRQSLMDALKEMKLNGKQFDSKPVAILESPKNEWEQPTLFT